MDIFTWSAILGVIVVLIIAIPVIVLVFKIVNALVRYIDAKAEATRNMNAQNKDKE